MTAQLEAQFIKELPVVVRPLGLYIIVAWYVGPGCKVPGGHWKVFREKFFSGESAEKFMQRLGSRYTQRRIYHLQ